MANDVSRDTSERPANRRPERKPGEAGLRGGELMRRGDAKPRRAARLTTTANQQLLERAGRARARLARSAVPQPKAKAKLSPGSGVPDRGRQAFTT